MAKSRKNALWSMIKGLLFAASASMVLMLILAALIVLAGLSNKSIMLINQFIKLISILTGVYAGVGVGGENGFLTGAVISSVYMIAGYALYIALGGGVFDMVAMLGEILLGAAVGAAAGAVLANLSPRRHPRHA